MSRRQIMEYLDLDLKTRKWYCHHCDYELGAAEDNFKKHLLICERDPKEIYPPELAGDPEYCLIREFYCPGCGIMMDVEVVPPGYPLIHNIELDIDSIIEKANLKG